MPQQSQKPRQSGAITDPKQIAILMMSKQNAVNEAKDDLTLTIRSMMDGANQIVQAYAEQMAGTEEAEKKCAILGKAVADQKKQIEELQAKVKQLECPVEKGGETEDSCGPPGAESGPEPEGEIAPGEKVRPSNTSGEKKDGAGPTKT